jgi:WD40 repeat protein
MSAETVALDEAGSARRGHLQTAPTERSGAEPERRASLPIVDASRYALADELSRGGMGRVLAATDRRLDRPVAVKQLVAGGRARFEREARLTARLQHPSIVRVYDAWREPGGNPAYAMEIVRGRSFDKVIAEADGLPARLALLPHVLAVAEAIAYAHSQRIIHRDLKPQNVLVGAFGETVVIDWGLAKELSATEPDEDGAASPPAGDGLTAVGAVVGTPAFMAPEQAAGQPVDERADVFALGAILHFLLAGATPARAGSLTGVPEELAAIVRKAMAPDPDGRYPSARELAQDLRRFQTGQLVAAHRYSVGALVRRWIARHRLATSVALATAISVAFSLGLSMSRIIRARRAAEGAARALYQEQGRRLLIAGDPMRALPYLAKAYQEGSRGADLRFLLARAARALEPEQRVLRGHGGRVLAAAFAPDGSHVLTAGEDGVARLWDLAHADAPPRAFTGHTDTIFAAAFSPDGARIVTASWDRSARIWDPATGRLLATLPHPGRVLVAVFSPDGSRLVTASGGDAAARVWDTASGQLLRTLEGHQGPVNAAAFSPDGARVVTGSADRTARVWDLANGRVELTLAGHQDQIWSVAFDRAGARVVTAGWDRAARLWDAHTGALLATFEHDPVPGAPVSVYGTTALFSPDGSRVATACADTAARIWDAGSGRLVRVLRGHPGYILSLAYSQDGRLIATASTDGSARIWDAASGELRAALHGHLDAIHRIAFSPDGARAVTASADHTARIWDATQSAARLSLRADDQARFQFAAGSPDGALLLAADQRQRVHLWRLPGGTSIADWGAGAEPRPAFASFDPAGTRIASIAGRAVEIRDVRDPQTVQLVVAGEGTGSITSTRFSPDGRRLVTAGDDGIARLWDAKGGQLLARLAGHTGAIWFATFSPDGTLVATAGQDRTARLWEAASGRQLRALTGHALDVVSVAFDRDGRRIVTASLDRTARTWDVASGENLALLEGHMAEVTFASFHPREPLVITSSLDGTARLWSADGALLDVVARHPSGINSALFTADGSAAITAGDDGSVRLWPIDREERAPAEVARVARCRAPFQLIDGRLVDAAIECAAPR